MLYHYLVFLFIFSSMICHVYAAPAVSTIGIVVVGVGSIGVSG